MSQNLESPNFHNIDLARLIQNHDVIAIWLVQNFWQHSGVICANLVWLLFHKCPTF